MFPASTSNFKGFPPATAHSTQHRESAFVLVATAIHEPRRLADSAVTGASCRDGKKSRETIYGASIRASARRAKEARETADKLACEAWNMRMLGYQGPAQPSPALGDALNAGYRYLEVRCLGCDTHQTVALDIIRRPKATPIHELERYMRCKDARRSAAILSSVAIWRRCGRGRFPPATRRRIGGRASDKGDGCDDKRRRRQRRCRRSRSNTPVTYLKREAGLSRKVRRKLLSSGQRKMGRRSVHLPKTHSPPLGSSANVRIAQVVGEASLGPGRCHNFPDTYSSEARACRAGSAVA